MYYRLPTSLTIKRGGGKKGKNRLRDGNSLYIDGGGKRGETTNAPFQNQKKTLAQKTGQQTRYEVGILAEMSQCRKGRQWWSFTHKVP